MRQHGKSPEKRTRDERAPKFQSDFEDARPRIEAGEIRSFRVSETRASRHISPVPPTLHNKAFIQKFKAMEFRLHRLEESVQIDSDVAVQKQRRARVTAVGDFGPPIDHAAVNMRPISNEVLTDYSRKRFDRLSLELTRGEE